MSRRIDLYLIVGLTASIALCPGAGRAQNVTYSYDELGRLVGVVDQKGNAALYQYDAVGNILSITRYSTTQVSLLSFTPTSGPVGTQVTISGSNFSATGSKDSVTFNGTAATIVSASTTTLAVSVPTGAKTGSIKATSPIGSATSTSPFTVTSSGGVPKITSFKPPIAVAGANLDILGVNFSANRANDRMAINTVPFPTAIACPAGVCATATDIFAVAPAGAGSGHVAIQTPAGQSVSAADLFIPPPNYTASEVAFTGRTNLTKPVTVSLSPNTIGMLLFDGTAGSKVSMEIPSSSPGSCGLQLYDPTNTAFGSAGDCSQSGGGFFDAQSIPRSGTLTALILPDSSLGSTATLNLYVFNDVKLTATVGGSAVTVTTTVPGQNAIVSFAGTAGQYVTIELSGSTYPNCQLTLNLSYSTDDFTNFSCSQSQSQQLNPLPATGTYQMLIDPQGPATGTVTVQLVGATNAGALTSGVPVTVKATQPGQNGVATFTGKVGDTISMLASGVLRQRWVC